MVSIKMLARMNSRIVYGTLRHSFWKHSSTSSAAHRQLENVIDKVKSYSEKKTIQVSISSGKSYNFPWLWLRDNCRCPKCFNPVMLSRTIDWSQFDITVKPTDIEVTEDSFKVAWSDGHSSSFTLPWLLERSFTRESQKIWLEDIYKPPRISWGCEEFKSILKRFSFHNILISDPYLLEWLETLAKYGVAIIEGVPTRHDQLRLLANRVAFIKRTHFGEEYEVRAKQDATNLAYQATPLQMHTDLPYYEYKAGVNLLHCIVQAEGDTGSNKLTDGLRVVERIKKSHPDAYRILADTLVDWSDIGSERGERWFNLHRAPIICEDKEGNLFRVNYSQQQRDSHFTVPLDVVNEWYEAHAIFTQELHHADNAAFFKTKPGEILTFDNVRVVHGRTGYNDVTGNERLLIGAYLDWDMIYSKMRVLRHLSKP